MLFHTYLLILLFFFINTGLAFKSINIYPTRVKVIITTSKLYASSSSSSSSSTNELLIPRLDNIARKITNSNLFEGLLGIIAFSLISGVDAVTTHDWVKYHLIDQNTEDLISSILQSVGLFHLICAPTSAVVAWQKSQPIIPATLKTLLIGGLALGQTIVQSDDKVIQFPWLDSGDFDGEPREWANNNSFVQAISKSFQVAPAASFKQRVADFVAGEFDAKEIDSKIDTIINSAPCVIFSWKKCPFCLRTKEILLKEIPNVNVKIIELDEGDLKNSNIGNQIRARLGRKTGRTSLPSVWIKGNFYGGCNDGSEILAPKGIQGLYDSGELENILLNANAINIRSSKLFSNDDGLEFGPWLEKKIGVNGMRAIGYISLTPYLMFAIRGLIESTN